MHWLKYWRQNYRRSDGRIGLSRKEFSKMLYVPGTIKNPAAEITCSEVLIGILEGGGITHPEIADRIAEVTECTAQQRDSMVHKKHHGTWKPKPKKQRKDKTDDGMLHPEPNGRTPRNARAVLKVDRSGQAVGIFLSMVAASEEMGCTVTAVLNRCNRKLSKRTDEFVPYGFTWRYADEWYNMNPDARAADMRAASMK